MDRRETILKAALESLAATGRVTIAEVRTRSGASVGSIYHHFGDRDGIASALYVEILRGYQAGALRALQRAAGAEAGVTTLVRHYLRWVERHPEQARFLFHGGVARQGAGEELATLNRGMLTAIAEWIATQPGIRPLSREVFFAAAFGPAQELSRAWLAGRVSSLRRFEAELAEAAWRALRAP